MSSVKISGLPTSSNLNSNPAQSIFPTTDLVTGQTTRLDAKSLGKTLYANNSLTVGTGGVLLPNLVAQFTGISSGYTQVNEQNINNQGTADYIVTADVGDDLNYYIDMGITNSQYSNTNPFNSLGTSIEPLSGYLYVTGNTVSNSSGNLVIGTVNPGTEIRLFSGGVNDKDVVVKIKANEVKFRQNTIVNIANTLLVNTITFYDNTSLTSFSAVANATANIAYITNVNLAQNTAIQLANNTANLAYALANTAVQNTATITVNNINVLGNTVTQTMNTVTSNVNGSANITGALNVNGIVSMNAQVVITNTTFSATQSAVTISATANVQSPSQAGTLLHLSSKANTAGRVIIDSFGVTQNTAYSIIAGRSSRGTVDAPTASQSGDILFRLAGNGYGTTGFAPLGVGRIDIVASENYTDSARGSQIVFYNNVNGSNTPIQVATFNALDAQFYGYVNPQKGFVYTPLVYPSSQTAITIDMSNNSLVRAQTATGITVTLSNLVAGKEVVTWITNTAGTNQTFTHGVSATNSTTNSTTWTIPGTSTILARYMCIDGTLANTLVAVTHA